MWSFGIVPDDIVGKFLLEDALVIDDIDDTIDTFFLERSVESLDDAIDPWTSGVGKLMANLLGLQIRMEASQKFTPVVCLDCMGGIS